MLRDYIYVMIRAPINSSNEPTIHSSLRVGFGMIDVYSIYIYIYIYIISIQTYLGVLSMDKSVIVRWLFPWETLCL